MSNRPKKHHFVPECYLKNFLDGNKFYTLDLRKIQNGLKERLKVNTPGKICYFEDYYKIDPQKFKIEGYDELFIETEALRRLEGEYNNIYFRLLSNNEICLEDCVNLSDFIIQLKIRNPFFHLHTIEKDKNLWLDKIFEEGFLLDKKFEHIPDYIKQFFYEKIKHESKTNPYIGKEIQLNSLIFRYNEPTSNNWKSREAIIDCEWKLCIAPENGPYFITSDNPDVSVGDDNIIYNTKFTGGFAFWFPLSPRHCLLISDSHRDYCLKEAHPYKRISKINVDSRIVILINDNLIQRINKLLIASDEWYLLQIADKNKPT